MPDEPTELVLIDDSDNLDEDLDVLLESDALCGVDEAMPVNPECVFKYEVLFDNTLDAALEAVLEPALGSGLRTEEFAVV